MFLTEEKPNHQEFLDAIRSTRQRTDRDGESWCSQSDSLALERAFGNWAVDRRLAGLVHQAVRLIRVLERLDRRGYLGFVYFGLHKPRPGSFRHAIGQACADGRLAGIVEIGHASTRSKDDSQPSPDGAGVVFLEPAMGVDKGPFVIEFGQMPRIVAFIDICHNMLGVTVVEQMVAPLTGPTCTASAGTVAKTFADTLRAWISARTASEYHSRLANVIRAYLERREISTSAEIDDRIILDFWCEDETVEVDGLRTFRSVARYCLTFRRAAFDVEQFGRARFAESDFSRITEDHVDVTATDENVWVSPLLRLAEPPSDRVKWIIDEEQVDFLTTYFSRVDRKALQRRRKRAATDDGERERDDEADATPTIPCLFGAHRPDPTFLKTALRYHHFGAVQDFLANTTAKRTGNRSPLDEETARYAHSRALARAVLDELEIAIGATAWILLQAGHHIGLLTAATLDSAPVAAFAKETAAARRADIPVLGGGQSLARLFLRRLETNDVAFRRRLESARKSIKRQGFRPGDEADPVMIEALAAGAPVLIDLVAEVRRIARHLDRLDVEAHFERDVAIFHGRFLRMYGAV